MVFAETDWRRKGMNKRKDFSGIIQNKLKREDFTEKEWKKILDCETKINQFIYENETFLMIIGRTAKPTEEMEKLLQNIAEGYAFLFLEGLDVSGDKSFKEGFKAGYFEGYYDEKCGREYENSAEKADFAPDDWR